MKTSLDKDYPPEIVIGDYSLSIYAGGLWINRLEDGKFSGEGGEFSKEEFLKVLDKFYKDNF